MDQQAASLLATLKRPAAPSDAKLNALNALKSDIKHYRVPENAQATIFECIKLAITQQASASLASAAFSTLGHLLKRLKIQDTNGVAITQLAPRLYPAILERLGDLREQMRLAASSALCEMWHHLGQDVEKLIREDAISGTNTRAKETGMNWVVDMHKLESLPFKSYVGPIVACVEDADGTVRDAAKHALIELFRDAPDRAKLDLKRQLKAHSVRHAIETQILTQIGATDAPKQTHEPDLEASTTRPLPTTDHATQFAKSINSQAAQPPLPQEVVPMDPLHVHSERELSDMFTEMAPHFEGKETEQNWIPRDKAVTKVRRLLTGNAPQDYHQAFMAGVKSVMDGVLKVANSLRTTMSSNGCQLVQELSQILGPAIDHHVEIMLQNFIKMSSATKHIAAENGRITTDCILQHCSYNVRMVQHIWAAAQEKNAQLRQCTPQWLGTILRRQAGYKSHFESTGGLDLAEKCIKKGLDDANPKVKESTRATYWTFAKTWPEKADSIMNKLDPKSRSMLEKDSNNPNAALFQSQTSSGAVSRATTPHGRTALKEMLAEQRRAKSAARAPERPTSAMASTTPARTTANRAPSRLRGESRVASNTSSTSNAAAPNSKNSLMSGPVRRPRKPEIQRPLTADPYASKRMRRPETPSNDSHGGSPPKPATKSSIPTPSSRERRKTTTSREASPLAVRRGPAGSVLSNSRPSSKDSNQYFSESTNHTATRRPQSTSQMPAPKQNSEHSLLPAMEEPVQHISHTRDSSRTFSSEHSPDIHQSPLKAMIEAARAKLDRPTSSSSNGTLSQIPIADPFQDDKIPYRGSPVKAINTSVPIYEDPEHDTAIHDNVKDTQQVLSEIPVNENVRMQSPNQSSGSSASPAGSPLHQTNGNVPMTPSTSKDKAELLRNRRLLVSGIERIYSRTLDAHGFRRVQELAKSTTDIWGGGEKYEELMSAVLAYLTTFEQDSKLAQLPAVKLQALGIVRALLTVHPKFARSWFDRALVTVIICRKGVTDNNNHIISDLERTADDIVRLGPTEACIDAVVEHLVQTSKRTVDVDEAAAQNVAVCTTMALQYLRMLVAAARSRHVDLGHSRRLALTQVIPLFLEDSEAEVRKTDIEVACEVYALYGENEAEFWQQFTGIEEGRKGLLTYYIARSAKAVGA